MGCTQSKPDAVTPPAPMHVAEPESNPVNISSVKNIAVGDNPPHNNSKPKKALTPEDMIGNMSEGKPLDASDISNFMAAKKQIVEMRRYAQQLLDNVEGAEGHGGAIHKRESARCAIYEKEDIASFRKKTFTKSDAVKKLIIDAIKPNVLFENDTEEEIVDLVDVFKPTPFKAGEVVINQGEQGDEFYVVESGELSIQVAVGEDKNLSLVKVGNYSAGNAFGELALIFGSPRAATITAVTDCKLWSLGRIAYRGVVSQHRFTEREEKLKFMRSCEVNGRKFTDVFDGTQIEDLTIALKSDQFSAGGVILRENEIGDTFYIIRSGTVKTYRRGNDSVLNTLGSNQSFGIDGVLRGTPSNAKYVAASSLSVYYLTKNDFNRMIGGLQNALDGKSVSRVMIKSESKKTLKTSMSTHERYTHTLDELKFFNVLGKGAFGKVFLVQAPKTKKVFALKALSKDTIVRKRQEDHVRNEYSLLTDLDHPGIIKIHCAMQDKRNIYFLFDLLPGGELMKHLTKRGKFNEDTTRFYVASMILAFEILHSMMIAYRDLKPENMVLDRKGYCVLVDFGLAKEIEEGQTFTFCGTPDYLAPEIIRGTGHDWGVDYWGLGVLLFELACGKPPFHASTQMRRTRQILKGYEFVRAPAHFSGGLNSLIEKLLVADQSSRLGRTQNGIQAIKNHRFFAGFDWDGLEAMQIPPPIKPKYPSDIKTLGKPDRNNALPPEVNWTPDFDEYEGNISLR